MFRDYVIRLEGVDGFVHLELTAKNKSEAGFLAWNYFNGEHLIDNIKFFGWVSKPICRRI